MEVVKIIVGKDKFITRCNNFDYIYHKMMDITDGDHEISQDAASWCELAIVGEEYEFREGKIVIESD